MRGRKRAKPHLKNLLLGGDVRDKILVNGENLFLGETVPNTKPVDEPAHVNVLDGPRDPEQLPVL